MTPLFSLMNLRSRLGSAVTVVFRVWEVSIGGVKGLLSLDGLSLNWQSSCLGILRASMPAISLFSLRVSRELSYGRNELLLAWLSYRDT